MRGRIVPALLVLLAASGSACAAVQLPVRDGAYCGPDAARIDVDSRAGTVSIDGYTCASPIFAADELQSIQCRQNGGPPERREFDVRVLNGALIYNHRWFRACAP